MATDAQALAKSVLMLAQRWLGLSTQRENAKYIEKPIAIILDLWWGPAPAIVTSVDLLVISCCP